jgi:hypothetical protein
VTIVLAAVVGAALVIWNVVAHRGPTPAARPTVRDPRDRWLAEASATAEAGRLLVQQIEPFIADGTATEALTAANLTTPLDDLTHHLAQLSVSAPTKMDERVCRSAAIRSQALDDALRARRGASSTDSDRLGTSRTELIDLQVECDVALRDLAQHVDLL